MADVPVADGDHVLRYVPKTGIAFDPVTNEPIGFHGTAFKQRPNERYLSAAWVELSEAGAQADKIAATAKAINKRVTRMRIADAFALAEAGALRDECKRLAHVAVGIDWCGKPRDPYTRVSGVPVENQGLQTAIGKSSWSGVVLAKTVAGLSFV